MALVNGRLVLHSKGFVKDFPNKPIRLSHGVGAGGSADLLSHYIARGISGPLGQSVTVEARGTGEVISGELVAKALPDGYTLLVAGASLWTAPLLQKVKYDVARDFSPITLAVTTPNIFVVPSSLPVSSIKEFISFVRARPGELHYASGLTGAPSHLAGVLFARMAGVDMVHVPYKNTAQLAVDDLIAGKVQMMIFSAGSGMPHVRSGKLRALAVTSAEPSALLPDLPTIAATLPGYVAQQPFGIFAPARTPAAVIERLNQEMVQVLNNAEMKKQFLDAGIEVVGSTPKEFADYLRSDIARIQMETSGIIDPKP